AGRRRRGVPGGGAARRQRPGAHHQGGVAVLPRAGAKGAPPALPIAALLAGAAALLAGAAAPVAGAGWPAFAPRALLGAVNAPSLVGLTHVFTLGFVGLVFAGTLQQLPAVMLVTDLAWPRLGLVALPLLLAGAGSVVAGFAAGFAPLPLALGGAVVSLAWLLLLAQLVATALRRWPKDAAGQALVASVAFLALTVVLGFALAGARSAPGVAAALGYPVRLHLTTGMFGAFLLGIAGAGQKLLGMFALAKGTAQWRLRLLGLLVALALLAEALAAFARLPLRLRLRRGLEPPIRRYVLAHAFLPVAGLLALAGLPAAAAAAFLVGFVGLAVSGMLVKILSFLTWTARFAGGAGVSAGAPLLRDLFRGELEPVTTWALAGGAASLSATLALRQPALAPLAAGLLLLGSASQLAQAVHVVVAALRPVRGAAPPPAAALATTEEAGG